MATGSGAGDSVEVSEGAALLPGAVDAAASTPGSVHAASPAAADVTGVTADEPRRQKKSGYNRSNNTYSAHSKPSSQQCACINIPFFPLVGTGIMGRWNGDTENQNTKRRQHRCPHQNGALLESPLHSEMQC